MTYFVTGWDLNGLDLRSLAMNIDDVSGWVSFPGLKSEGGQYAFMHGEDHSGRRFYQARDIDLNMVILDTPLDGIVTSSRAQHLEENMEALLRALHNSDDYLTLTKTVVPATNRSIKVRPINAIRFEDGIGGLSRRVRLILRTGYPFWHGDAFDIIYSTGTSNFDNIGSAPINDMVITFNNAGSRITNNLNGDWVESSAAGVQLDVGSGLVVTGSSAAISTNRPWFFQLEPGLNSLTRTGGASAINLEGFYGYF